MSGRAQAPKTEPETQAKVDSPIVLPCEQDALYDLLAELSSKQEKDASAIATLAAEKSALAAQHGALCARHAELCGLVKTIITDLIPHIKTRDALLAKLAKSEAS